MIIVEKTKLPRKKKKKLKKAWEKFRSEFSGKIIYATNFIWKGDWEVYERD